MGHYYWRSAVAVLAVAALSGSAALAADDPPPQPAPGTLLIVAGTGPKGFSGDGGPATQAQLSAPFGLAFDAAGNLFIAELTNARVRKVTPEGTINTVVGGGKTAPNKVNGIPAAEAKLGDVHSPSFDGAGNLFLSGFFSGRVWKVTPEGLINTVAQIDRSAGLAMDATGSLFIAVFGNSRVRKVSPEGIITTVAGTGKGQLSGVGGPATSAVLRGPVALAVDAAGNLFIADTAWVDDRAPSDEHVLVVVGVAAPGLIAGKPFPKP